MVFKSFFVLFALFSLMILTDQYEFSAVAIAWNFLSIASMVAVGVLIFNRIWISAAFVAAGYLSLIAADRAKLYFMDDHLRWSDLMNVTRHFGNSTGLNQFVELIGPYVSGLMDWKSFLVLFAATLAIAACFRLEPPFFRAASFFGHPFRRFSVALVILAVVFVPASLTAPALFRAVYADRLSASNYHLAGMPLFLFASKGDVPRTRLFSEADRAAALEVSSTAAAAVMAPRELPDIVLWFNESTFDPDDLRLASLESGKWEKAKSDLSFKVFQPRKETIQYGFLNVGIFGGKSWNTVFALQTGAHVAWFSDDTYAASALSARVDETLFRRLKAAGYAIESLYAQDGYLFDAAKSEIDYGADRFYGTEFLSPNDQNISRATDAEVADGLRRLLANPSDGPRAFFVFTSANHGPYPSTAFRRTEAMVDLWGDLPDGVLDYLSRVSETDRVLTALADDVLGRQRPTILLHLGDHKPRIPGVTFAEENKYGTYYQLMANFPPPEAESTGRQDSDIIFAASKVLDLAGVDGGPLFRANKTVADECRRGVENCSARGRDLLRGYLVLASDNLGH